MSMKKSSISRLALLFSLGAALQPTASLSINPVGAQSANVSLPSSVPQGTTIQIDGSTSMASVNRSLKQRFEQQYPGTKVNVKSGSTSAGLQALLDGKADLAAIGRPLTDSEKSQGLVSVPIARDKIAIVVGPKNSLSKSLDINQFAKIFRGEIKNWSQVGGKAGAIRVVDRPALNDTRQAFRDYPAFKSAPFKASATADKLNDESAAAVIQKLGANGISYLPASQVRGQTGVKTVPIGGKAPTNPQYPFSQTLFYVYRAANPPSPAVQAFLGYATAKAGQEAIKASGVEAISVSNPEGNVPKTVGVKAAPLSSNAAVNSSANAGAKKAAKDSTGNNAASLNAVASNQTAGDPSKTVLLPSSGATASAESERETLSWWWLLPLGSLAALFWMLGKERSRSSPQAYNSASTGDDAPFPEGFAPHQSEQNFDGTQSNSPSDLTATVGGSALADAEGSAANSYLESDRGTLPNESGLAAGTAIAGGAGTAAWSFLSGNQAQPDSSRLNAKAVAVPSNEPDNFPPVGAEGQISILPRSAGWATIRWDVPRSLRADAPRPGGERLVVRFYDVTGVDLATQTPDRFQQFDCDELDLSCNVPIPASERNYLAEIGYLSADDHWTRFARSTPVWIPATSRIG